MNHSGHLYAAKELGKFEYTNVTLRQQKGVK